MFSTLLFKTMNVLLKTVYILLKVVCPRVNGYIGIESSFQSNILMEHVPLYIHLHICPLVHEVWYTLVLCWKGNLCTYHLLHEA
jgi:hypothetical protein